MKSETSVAIEQIMARAESQLEQGRVDEAITTSRMVLETHGEVPAAHLVLGQALSLRGEVSSAFDHLYRAVQIAPGIATFHYNFAVVLERHGNVDWAMVEYSIALQIDADLTDALWNYGELLRVREHFGAALRCFERLERIEGKRRPYLSHRMAVCYARLGVASRAQALFEAELSEQGDPVTHWEYAHFLLEQGRLDEAWPHYARRFDAGERINVTRRHYPYIHWQGQFERSAVLLVQGEQGAGDQILFARYLRPLEERAAHEGMRVVVTCHPGLVRLFTKSFPKLHFVGDKDSNPGEVVGALRGHVVVWQTMLADLPLWFERPQTEAYLEPADEDVALMRVLLNVNTLNRTTDDVLRVGLAWSAGMQSQQLNRQLRNVDLYLLNALAARAQQREPRIEYYSLHTVEHRGALSALPDVRIQDMSGYLIDFSRTAALINEMDIVISVCTSIANLSGGLGADTGLLLHKYGDWRWSESGWWYPHISAYRQEIVGDWRAPLCAAFDLLGKRQKSMIKT
ncbi:tetratricopeptide repeat protein [Burkholderia gladioli]|uniref:tetratricopeptide repeat protein n=1 Tax=Burkholderia gladioli TaxID=28095 RepID=UPI003F7A2AB5